MLEILYRIYEVASEEEKQSNLSSENSVGLFNSISKLENNEIVIDCMICESREQFKDLIRFQYGNDIRFAYSKKLQAGQLYCVIIGEHCYNTERYFNKVEFVCDYCGNKVMTYYNKPIRLSNYEIEHYFYSLPNYEYKQFCCESCRYKFVEAEQKRVRATEEKEFYVSRDMFTEKIVGYIYKITKKSTGEFYIGQTIYAPIFRWGQHLKTERFDIKNILDYQFETIEVVQLGENILEREKYHIQKYYKENPTKSLNIMQTANLDQMDFLCEVQRG